MGKWAQVRCACESRPCPHPEGILYQIWPGPVISLGALVGGIFKDTPNLFEVYALIGDWRNHEDEELRLSVERASLWQMESEELRRAIRGEGNLPFQQVKKLWLLWLQRQEGLLVSIKDNFRRAEEAGMGRLVQLRAGLEEEVVTPESAARELEKAIDTADELCRASLQTGNPIELYW